MSPRLHYSHLHCRLHNEIAKIAFVHVDSDPVNMSRLQVTQFVADLSESDSALTIHNSKHSFANSVVQTAMQITVMKVNGNKTNMD